MTGYAPPPPDSDPMPDYSTDGAALLDDVRAFLARFVAFPSPAAAVATTLWAAHAHLIQSSEESSRPVDRLFRRLGVRCPGRRFARRVFPC